MAIFFSPSGMPFRQKLKDGKDEEVFKFKRKSGKKCGMAKTFLPFEDSVKKFKKM
jgi:hypothetical protein